MRIRGKLITAFFILIMIPILLFGLAGSFIMKAQVDSIQQSYDIETDTIQLITNPIQILNLLTRGIYNDIMLSALKSPHKLEDLDYIDKLNIKLKEKYSFIVLRKDSELLYVGDENKIRLIEKDLPAFGDFNTESDGGIYLAGKKDSFLVKKQDFYFRDRGKGSVFVVTDVNTLIPQIRTSVLQLGVAFLIIIGLTAAILIIWIYQSIWRPLTILRMATNKMKDGILDFTIEPINDDEMGSLFEDFDEMRVRLKELIEVRLQYEDDTKELISNISHDLKTPITAIKGYAEGVIDGVANTPEKMDKYIKTIYTKANDMSSLVDELSFYSKIDCNNIPYNFNSVNLEHYFGDCIEELSLDLELNHIDIGYFNYTNKNISVIADVEQVKRVVNNIIGNSVKYIDKKKGLINVRMKEADDAECVRIEIEDNGKGIAGKDIGNIFERFYRTDASRNSSQGGSGLGLAIAKKIIEDHGGRIWASSKEGVGTIIYFTLRKIPEDEKEM